MRILYKGHYNARYQEIADLIPAGCTVVDVCAGDCYLYREFLCAKAVQYTALDISPQFVRAAQNHGINARVFDARTDELPQGDVLVMQGSLYQFLPRAEDILQRMISAARLKVIIAEPIRNLSASTNPLINAMARYLTRSNGETHNGLRFDKESLQNLFVRHGVERSFLIPGEREMIGVFTLQR